MRRVLAAGALFVVATAALPARAADPDKLFQDGVALMEQQKYAEALPKLEEAQRLDPGIGTQFDIAVCYEKLGKLGTAYRNYAAVEAIARASGKKQREESAHAKLEALRPRVPALVLTTVDADATLKVDGTIVPLADYKMFPVDPGVHRVDAEAPAKKPWTASVTAPVEGGRLTVSVPALVLAKETEVVTLTKETTNRRRTLGFVFGGVGAAGAIAATVTGILILSDKSTASSDCNPQCQSASGRSAVNQGKVLVPINYVSWGVAIAGLGAGAYLLLTSGDGDHPAPKTALAPFVGPDAWGVSFAGRL